MGPSGPARHDLNSVELAVKFQTNQRSVHKDRSVGSQVVIAFGFVCRGRDFDAAGGGIQFLTVQWFTAQSPSLSPFNRLDMT